MNRTKKLISSFVAAAVLSLCAAAQAQTESTPPPTESAPPPPATHHSSSSGGEAGIGVGAAVTLASLPGVFGAPSTTGLFVYDAAQFHIEGMLGFASAEVNAMGYRGSVWIFGAGGWFHFHKGSSSDFSLGAIIAIDTTSGPGPSQTITVFEPGAQVRAFLTPNVAAFGRVGLSFRFGDTGNGTEFGLGGQPSGSFGFAYFFR